MLLLPFSVFVIVDAVDESQHRVDLLKILPSLITEQCFNRVRLIATSREYYDIEACFSPISTAVSMENPLLQDDIRRLVHTTLRSNQKFESWPQDLLADVEDAIAEGAKGI